MGEGDMLRALVVLCFLLLPGLARADEPTITVTVGNETRSFTRGKLLARPDATTIQVARDVAYRAPMTYRAVPVAALLAGMTIPADSVIEAVALNGFVAQTPARPPAQNRREQGCRLACDRTCGASLATNSRKGRERRAILHCLDGGRRSATSGASNGRINWQGW
jgi:hypothetical protein